MTEKAATIFLSTPSARRATCVAWIFKSPIVLFLSTPSARRATCFIFSCVGGWSHFYPRPPRGGRRLSAAVEVSAFAISIHALREEGDLCSIRLAPGTEKFLSTPSARRATIFEPITFSSAQHFYPRPPRGGRLTELEKAPGAFDFYPRPPRGGRLDVFLCRDVPGKISIHALREEGDPNGV